jgi:dTDP-4-dehydrorhamnose reductase
VAAGKIKRIPGLLSTTVLCKGAVMNIIGTGLSGMVGATVVSLLQDRYTFENLSLEVGVDITNKDQVESYLSASDAPWVLHFAAKTQVDESETERSLGEKSPTWIINVDATKTLVDVCRTYNKKLLYISTDFVFSGGEKVYTEQDQPDPIGWYAITKYEGEKCIEQLGDNGVILRIAYPYGATDGPKKDFVGRFRELFSEQKTITAPVDQYFTPTYIPDIASAIDGCITQKLSGIYHCVGSSTVSSYDAAIEIAQAFGYNDHLVEKTTVADFYKDRAPRATKLYVSNQKLSEALHFTPLNFLEGIQQLKGKQK